MTTRAPNEWSLTKDETIASYKASKQSLQYTLSLDINFAAFLGDNVTMQKEIHHVSHKKLHKWQRRRHNMWAAVNTKNASVVKPTNVLRTYVTKI